MTFELTRRAGPLVVSMPHVGTLIPEPLHGNYVERALAVEDTDWHLDRFYDWLGEIDVTVIRPLHSRYVVDLNRPPDDAPMYPGAANTELCPTRFFTGDALYGDGAGPDARRRASRRDKYWAPYHAALRTELERVREAHGYVLLWDAHSIRSRIPWLFEGRLPDLNVGTADGRSADATVADAIATAAAATPEFTHVLNGRFKGGYITRHYGDPARNIHAVQLEMCQCLYMQEEPPFAYDAGRAARVQPVVRDMMQAALAACEALHAG